MYDGLFANLGRNDACWCGSGKKYKKCHCDFDEKLEELYLDGEIVPSRDLIKSAEDIEGIKVSAAVNIGALDEVTKMIKPGISTLDIDDVVREYTYDNGAIPAPYQYEGFPLNCCTSVNDIVCHGIPSADLILKEGDIVNVDCSTIKGGYFSDSSRMFIVGEAPKEIHKFVETVKKSINVGLTQVKPWFHLQDMARELQQYVEGEGYSVVREYGGHGCGKEFHEEPWVSHTIYAGENMIMPPGMVFTIEPMVNMGKYKIKNNADHDGWTVRTKDHSLSAQWEIQVAITEDGYEILTY